MTGQPRRADTTQVFRGTWFFPVMGVGPQELGQLPAGSEGALSPGAGSHELVPTSRVRSQGVRTCTSCTRVPCIAIL